jgi:N-acyl-phosphatidylethanolamine-hydrolysing phospholipase D
VRSLLLGLGISIALAATGCDRLSMAGRFFAGNAGSFFSAPRPVAHKLSDPRAEARLAVLWVGHATLLVQLEDRFVLTDPVFTETVGQISRRLVEPGLDPDRLPTLDAVVISHMHFDHLSLGSLDRIEHRTRVILLPEGGAVYVPRSRRPTVELPTFTTWEDAGLRVTAVPVRHNGWRYAGDASWMTTSYTGYVIEYRGLTVYFGGDTAYDQAAFRRTRARFPRIDVALLPIAPIEPRDFMCRFHTDPAEALDAFRDLGATWMVPMHFDTFVNSLDALGDAPTELRRQMAARGLTEGEVALLQIGERRILVP